MSIRIFNTIRKATKICKVTYQVLQLPLTKVDHKISELGQSTENYKYNS